jgi:hypothetical protein
VLGEFAGDDWTHRQLANEGNKCHPERNSTEVSLNGKLLKKLKETGYVTDKPRSSSSEVGKIVIVRIYCSSEKAVAVLGLLHYKH